MKILSELKKGIPSLEINEAISGINEREYNNVLQTILKSKNKSIKANNERERFYKLLRFAAGRGFTTQEAGSCLKKILMASTDIELDYDEDME